MKKIIVIVVFTVLLCFSLVGCSINKEEKNREEMIQSVVELMLNCPDQELIQLTKEVNTEKKVQRLEELYSPYFTEDGYNQLVANRQLLSYHLRMDELGSQMKVDKVEIEKSDSESVHQYTIAITLSIISADGTKKTSQASGQAEIDKESNKISYFFVRDVPTN